MLFNSVNLEYNERDWNIIAVNFAYKDGVVNGREMAVGRGLGLFTYANPPMAQYAMGKLNGLLIAGRELDVRPSNQPMDCKAGSSPMRGQTRTSIQVWECAPGPMDRLG